jgi:hypothetical protein
MSPSLRWTLVLAACLIFADAVHAQVRGISYTVAPEVGRYYFDSNAGLADDYFYGGMLGFGFGEFVELSARYTIAPNLRRDLSGISGVSSSVRDRLAELPERTLTMQTYGGALRVNLGSGGLIPFVKVGTGILEFDGDDFNRSRLIYATGGGGVQLSAGDRYAISLSAENLTYRQNLGATMFTSEDFEESGLVPQNFRANLVYNWAVSAGLKVYLGGIAPGSETDVDRELRRQLQGGLRGLQLIVEPFYGVVNFNEELGFAANQHFGGVFAGIDMGPYVGLRGFYWRGMEGGEVAFQDIQAYGGELRLAFGEGMSVSPHFVLGGGYLDPLSGYEGRDGMRPSGEPFVMGGAGLAIPMSERIELTGSFRFLLTSSEAVDNVTQPADIYLSPMYSGGIRFSLGGTRPDVDRFVREEEIDDDLDERDPVAAEIRRLREQIDQLERERTVDTARVRPREVRVDDDRPAAPARRTYRSDQMVTIPIPEEGEIYIRYGPPAGTVVEALPGGQGVAVVDTARTRSAAGLTTEEIQRIVRATIREEMAALQTEPGDPAALLRLEQRINEQLDRMQLRLERGLTEQRRQDPVTLAIDGRGVTRLRGDRGIAAVHPFAGFMVGQTFQATAGIRADYRGDFLPFLSWYPEMAVGVGGGGYSYNLNMTGVYRLDFFRQLAPYAGLGVGMLGFSEAPEDVPGVQFLLNKVVGTEFLVGDYMLFAEFMLMDFGDFGRVGFGLRYSF